MGSPRKAGQVSNARVSEFTSVIEGTATDEWHVRAEAFWNLVAEIPDESYSVVPAWYNTPAVLRQLTLSVSALLKDARSMVVKRTCASLTILFARCKADARYLLKDLMSTVLAVHGQTVQVIRLAVQNMIVGAIPEVPCKMVMPLWMERLKVDKSRTVREACALYLGHALKAWTEEGYLTEEIWMHVGGTLLRTLRDPSPAVRAHAKTGLEHIMHQQSVFWENLINDPSGPASKDAKLKRWIKAQGQKDGTDVEELSVTSRFSYNSDSRYSRNYSSAPTTRHSPRRGLSSRPSRVNDDVEDGVPLCIDVKSPQPVPRKPAMSSGLGPPLRPSTLRPPSESPTPSSVASFATPPRPPTQSRQRTPVAASPRQRPPVSTPPTRSTESSVINEPSPAFPNDLQGLRNTADSSKENKATSETEVVSSPISKTVAKYSTGRIDSDPTMSEQRSQSVDSSEQRPDNSEHTTPAETQVAAKAPGTSTPSTESSPEMKSSPETPVETETAEYPEKSLSQGKLSPATAETETVASVEIASSQSKSYETDTVASVEHITSQITEETETEVPVVASPVEEQPITPTTSDVSVGQPDKRKQEDTIEDGPFVVNMQKLKEHASKRRSRNSILMQERFRASGSGGVSSEDESRNDRPIVRRRGDEVVAASPFARARRNRSAAARATQAPEHMVIAVRLLKAHKMHVDKIMETLKMEMDALRDFDGLLEEAGRPTEEEVLDYFENVGLCLDQRTQASARLQHELDRISRGEPPEPKKK